MPSIVLHRAVRSTLMLHILQVVEGSVCPLPFLILGMWGNHFSFRCSGGGEVSSCTTSVSDFREVRLLCHNPTGTTRGNMKGPEVIPWSAYLRIVRY